MYWQFAANSLDSEFWRMRSARWDHITVPTYAVGNWTGMGLHLRGATEAFMHAATRHKKMRIHSGTHFHPFHSEEGRLDQLRFFDYWLKGMDTGIMDEPPVKLMIRTGGDMTTRSYKFRFENEWPLARTQWTRMHLQIEREATGDADAVEGRLAATQPENEHKVTYSATGMTRAGVASGSSLATSHGTLNRTGVSFQTPPLEKDTEVTGPIVLNLWVSSTSEDMDIFATLRNIDPDGNDVWEIGQQQQPVPVAKGWLRASHRKLDAALSLPYRPYHAHDERQWLKPGEVVQLQIEVWPTCMVFRRGHRIRLDIQPRDGVGSAPYTHYSADYNTGRNTIHTGGSTASYLLLPVIPTT